jgi:DNA-binding transcriptional ArsR family regulator
MPVRGVGLSQHMVTRHLKKLAEAGLATGERRGVWTYCRVDNDAFAVAGRLLAPATAGTPCATLRPPILMVTSALGDAARAGG